MKRIIIAIIIICVLINNTIYAKRYLMTLEEQSKKADCIVVASFLSSQTIEPEYAGSFEKTGFTLFEFKTIKDIKTGEYGSLRNIIIYVISQTRLQWHSPHEPERYSPKFTKDKEYILFLKQSTSSYLFNFIQDFRKSIEYDDEIIVKIKDNISS